MGDEPLRSPSDLGAGVPMEGPPPDQRKGEEGAAGGHDEAEWDVRKMKNAGGYTRKDLIRQEARDKVAI